MFQAKLEDVSKKGNLLEVDKNELQLEYDTTRRQLQELQQVHSKVKGCCQSVGYDKDLVMNTLTCVLQEKLGLKEALAAAKKELREMRKKVESLTSDLGNEQEKRMKM